MAVEFKDYYQVLGVSPKATDDEIKKAFRALARKYHDTQAAMLIRLESPFPSRVLDIVVFWAALLFLGDGVMAPLNAVTVCAHLAGALGIATAAFLILELSHPYGGYIRLAPDGVDRMLQGLGTVEVSSPAKEPGAVAMTEAN